MLFDKSGQPAKTRAVHRPPIPTTESPLGLWWLTLLYRSNGYHRHEPRMPVHCNATDYLTMMEKYQGVLVKPTHGNQGVTTAGVAEGSLQCEDFCCEE